MNRSSGYEGLVTWPLRSHGWIRKESSREYGVLVPSALLLKLRTRSPRLGYFAFHRGRAGDCSLRSASTHVRHAAAWFQGGAMRSLRFHVQVVRTVDVPRQGRFCDAWRILRISCPCPCSHLTRLPRGHQSFAGLLEQRSRRKPLVLGDELLRGKSSFLDGDAPFQEYPRPKGTRKQVFLAHIRGPRVWLTLDQGYRPHPQRKVVKRNLGLGRSRLCRLSTR